MSGSEWVICKYCSLKYRARESVCPRCDKPFDEAQVRWGDHRGPTPAPSRSKLAIVSPILLLLAGGAGAFVYFAPAGLFNPSLSQKITRACRGTDCECVGPKTEGLMSAEQRAASNVDDPAVRELMNTAEQLCLKDRLVSRCVNAKQGTELQCICVAAAAANAFTIAELDALFGEGAPPRYASIRTDCVTKIPAR